MIDVVVSSHLFAPRSHTGIVVAADSAGRSDSKKVKLRSNMTMVNIVRSVFLGVD